MYKRKKQFCVCLIAKLISEKTRKILVVTRWHFKWNFIIFGNVSILIAVKCFLKFEKIETKMFSLIYVILSTGISALYNASKLKQLVSFKRHLSHQHIFLWVVLILFCFLKHERNPSLLLQPNLH